MNKIAIDIVGPLAKTADGNTHILTIYDPFSHWPSAYATSSTASDRDTLLEASHAHTFHTDHGAFGQEQELHGEVSTRLPHGYGR